VPYAMIFYQPTEWDTRRFRPDWIRPVRGAIPSRFSPVGVGDGDALSEKLPLAEIHNTIESPGFTRIGYSGFPRQQIQIS